MDKKRKICEGSSFNHVADDDIAINYKFYEAVTMMRLFTLLGVLCIVAATAFTTPPCAVSSPSSACTARTNAAAITDLNVLQSPRFIKPYSTALEVRLNGEDEEVKVVEMEVDAFTLTAVGFGLIAFNFLVLANMGDAGIGGIVARIMNTFG